VKAQGRSFDVHSTHERLFRPAENEKHGPDFRASVHRRKTCPVVALAAWRRTRSSYSTLCFDRASAKSQESRRPRGAQLVVRHQLAFAWCSCVSKARWSCSRTWSADVRLHERCPDAHPLRCCRLLMGRCRVQVLLA
jgi:hypothetical protein